MRDDCSHGPPHRDIRALDLASGLHRPEMFRVPLPRFMVSLPVPLDAGAQLTEAHLRNLARDTSISTLAASIRSHATTLRNPMPVYDGDSEVLVQARPAPNRFARFANVVAVAAGNQWAFVAALSSIVIWLACGPLSKWSNTWQLVINTGTTVVTFLMIFLVQNTQNREAAALSLKDELWMRLQHETLMFQRSMLPQNHPAHLSPMLQADRPTEV